MDITDFSQLFMLKGILASLTIGIIFMVILIGIGFYIYHALAWQSIGKKQKYKRPWLAWIPFANISMILEMGKFHWAWVFLLLVPVLGWIAVLVLVAISIWRVFEVAKYPGWLSLNYVLSMVPWFGLFFGIVYMITIGMIAWGKDSSLKIKPIEKRLKAK